MGRGCKSGFMKRHPGGIRRPVILSCRPGPYMTVDATLSSFLQPLPWRKSIQPHIACTPGSYRSLTDLAQAVQEANILHADQKPPPAQLLPWLVNVTVDVPARQLPAAPAQLRPLIYVYDLPAEYHARMISYRVVKVLPCPGGMTIKGTGRIRSAVIMGRCTGVSCCPQAGRQWLLD